MLMHRTGFTASRGSWVAFLISVAFLVLFAFFMYQIHSARIEWVVETDAGFLEANSQSQTSGKDIDPETTLLPPESTVKELGGTTTITKAS
jgi:hypothetical protein